MSEPALILMRGRDKHRARWSQHLARAGGNPVFIHAHGNQFKPQSAVYEPTSATAELIWPEQRWRQTLSTYTPGQRDIVYSTLAETTPR